MSNSGLLDRYSSQRAGEIGMIAAIALWCDCLQGRAPLERALGMLSESLGVEAIALTRAARDRAHEVNSLFFDNAAKAEREHPLEQSFAASVLGPYFHRPKPGSVWFKTLTEIDVDPKLDRFHRRRRLTELAVIPLSVEDKSVMFLELHFSTHHGQGQHALINMCAPTLADTWARRKSGLMTELILQRNRPNPSRTMPPAVLGDDNPTGLSRAEFRVCLLLSKGLSKRRICQQQRISTSTLRTHLRNIYAKTETCNQAELLYLLLSAPSADARDIRDTA